MSGSPAAARAVSARRWATSGQGYTYPNFNAQITYSTAGNKEGQLTVGLFDPSVILDAGGLPATYDVTQAPRLEAGYTWTKHSTAGSADKLMIYASGLLANAKNSVSDKSVTPWGLAGGVQWGNDAGIELDGSGFYQTGVGSYADVR